MGITRVDFVVPVHFAGSTVTSISDKDCALEADVLAGAACVLAEHRAKKIMVAVPMSNVKVVYFSDAPKHVAQAPTKK